MLLLIPLLPLVGFLINATLGRRLSKAVSGAVANMAIFGSFGVSLAAVLQMVTHVGPLGVAALQQTSHQWLSSGGLNIPLALRLDQLSALMILVITGVGSVIHFYSTAYMEEETDGEYARYFSYLNLFASFMLILVLGASFPVMFIGWEGVGLCSYLLIGFWFTKPSAADAGKKAFVVNRIGDFGFVLGMVAIFATFGTLDFREVAIAAGRVPVEQTFGIITLITLLLFLGATGKSAQIPLFVWLPDAMEGPTPVSALIHAATMVTAGVYMIGRNAVLFSHAPMTMEVVAIVGCLTALMAGTIGLVQNDIKRVLAYSTVSQLGYMFLAMGVGAFSAGIFHLYTHAFFKALLFLGAGAVIHALHGEQDLRNMGGLRRALPVTYWTFLIGTLAIAGVPGFAGFFSKDEILSKTYDSGHYVLWAVGVVTALLTATYMFRLLYLTFFGERRTPHPPHLHDAPAPMAIVLIVLAIGSAAAGYVGMPRAIGADNAIDEFLATSFDQPIQIPLEAQMAEMRREAKEAKEAHETAKELGLMGVSTAAALGGIGLATLFFRRKPEAADRLAARFSGIHKLLLGKYFVDEVYDEAIVQPIKSVSTRLLWRGIDTGIVDGTVNAVGLVVRGWSAMLRRLQTGSVRAYAMSLLVGVLAIVGYYLWR